MSTFGALNTAWSGLAAARRGVDVVGQNMANLNTPGYTRQRVTQAALPPASSFGLLQSGAPTPGLGVSVLGVARIGDEWVDARVRTASASSGYWDVRADVLSQIEKSFNEPSEHGLAARLQAFWSSWEDLGNRAGEAAPAAALLETARTLTTSIAEGYRSAATLWQQTRTKADALVAEVNTAAAQVSDLNAQIRKNLAAGTSPNELIDQRAQLIERIAAITGAESRPAADGTVEVLVAGNPLVSADRTYPLALTGDYVLGGAAVTLGWERGGAPVGLEAGELAGTLAALAPATAGGTGGLIAETAETYNRLATALAAQVNAVHQTGESVTGASGLDFFSLDAAAPPALGLGVAATGVADIAVAAPGAGSLDGSIADAIAQLRNGPGSVDATWSTFVTGTAVASRSAKQQSTLSALALDAARDQQASVGGVDPDEETLNLMMYQTAYQGAARVISTIDEMLDTLINRTGLVGR
ncbi:flagellar hook-associated protein FlgK [Ruicaihuangia caeni]|uniref:Flagellar hook-associated protein 1 n=1 Tax=Ruicaihuangia caeni TaxID=3042517 RepID=A0AAW6T228_9MICO|nr:flagellar hook-associated protein FlgK [Klugiella sp. YN-L-19]MDI2097866.1 flagellar hook-associated protein FlgK [Klugiella sp. YN-L-19]